MNETTIAEPPRTEVIQLGPQDLEHAQQLNFWQFMRTRSGIIQIVVLSAAATALFAVLLPIASKGKSALSFILPFALASPFIVVASSVAVIFGLGARRARKAFAQQKSLQMPYQVSWTEQGLLLESEYGDARMPWGDFRKVWQDQHLILLYESDRLFRMIPKRCLTQAQLADLQLCMASVPRR